MKALFALVVTALLALSGAAFAANDGVDDLVEALESGIDFRVRVQAALRLGKVKTNTRARVALEDALTDEHAAVRAASAAALKVLGDRRAIPALVNARNDSSAAVRSQVKTTLDALRTATAEASQQPVKAEVVVQVGKMSNGSTSQSSGLVAELRTASRQRLANMPGVEVTESDAISKDVSKTKKLPVVMVTGRLRRLLHSTEGQTVVYSASVEYVVHQMPGQTIRGKVTGSASARASVQEIRNKEKLEDLRRSALEAAIDSAMKRAPEAIKAASK